MPDPHPDAVEAERRLRSVDAGERVLRVDVAVRAAAASLVDGPAQIAVVRAGPDGLVELTLTGTERPAAAVGGWRRRWRLPGATPIELLAEAARTVGAPCVALAQLGVDDDGCEVLVDLEALGVLAIDAAAELADAVVHGIAATLASSIFAEVAHLVGAGVDEDVFLGHRHAHALGTVDDALELAATVVGATAAARAVARSCSAPGTRAGRHGNRPSCWSARRSPARSTPTSCAPRPGGRRPRRRRRRARCRVRRGRCAPPTGAWVLEPLGIALVPVGLSTGDVAALHAVIDAADAPLIADEAGERPIRDRGQRGDRASDGRRGRCSSGCSARSRSWTATGGRRCSSGRRRWSWSPG